MHGREQAVPGQVFGPEELRLHTNREPAPEVNEPEELQASSRLEHLTESKQHERLQAANRKGAEAMAGREESQRRLHR